jgi:retron-type reverse transcriptase
MQQSVVLRAIARAVLAGEPAVPEITARVSRALGKRWRWIAPLAQRYANAVVGRTRPRRQDVVRFVREDPGFLRAWAKHSHEFTIDDWLTDDQKMQPVWAARSWNVPGIESVGALAKWLGVLPSKLLWFADLKGLGYRTADAKIWHYHYKILAKQYGNVRLIEAPKTQLKQLQRHILGEILEKIPPHPSVHGFVKGRSVQTFVTPHVNQSVVLRMDLQNFFPSFRAARIQGLFRTLGYPDTVAELLAGICTNLVPRGVWSKPPLDTDPRAWAEGQVLYARPHLPQGAPTSPALANLCAYRMDCRLAGLANSVGSVYTRYADDLAFSGNEEFDRRVDRFATHVAAILIEEGFVVQFRKTRVMRRGVRQHLAGLVANQHINVMRRDFDQLKATLTNCARQGPESQNRHAHPDFRSHLVGKVAFVESVNARKGERLRAIFNRIRWE